MSHCKTLKWSIVCNSHDGPCHLVQLSTRTATIDVTVHQVHIVLGFDLIKLLVSVHKVYVIGGPSSGCFTDVLHHVDVKSVDTPKCIDGPTSSLLQKVWRAGPRRCLQQSAKSRTLPSVLRNRGGI